MEKKNTKKTPNKGAKKSANKVEKKVTKPVVEEVKVAPKREKRHEEKMDTSFVEKDVKKSNLREDLVWLGVIGLLIILIGGSFILSQRATKEEKVNSNISTLETLSDEKNGEIEITLVVKTEVGVKEVKLPNNEKLTFKGKKEVKVKYTVTENGEYEFVVTDMNGKKKTKKIKIGSFNTSVAQDKTLNTQLVYYPTTGKVEEEVKVEAILTILTEAGTYESLVLEVESSAGIKSYTLLKNNEKVENYDLKDTIVEDGNYQFIVEDNEGNTRQIEFTIDSDKPRLLNDNFTNGQFTNGKVEIQFDRTAKVTIKIDGELTANEVILEEGAKFIFDKTGYYELTAIDAEDETKITNITFTIDPNELPEIIFANKVISIIDYDSEKYDYTVTRNGVAYPYELGQEITEAGNYEVVVTDKEGNLLTNLSFHVSIEDPTVEFITESTFVVNDDNEVVAVEYTWTNSQGTESTKTPVDVVLGEEFTATVPTEEEDYTLKVYVTDQNNQTHEFTSDKTISVIEEPVVNNANETNTDTVDETTVDNSAE